jgi:high-affinity Fe2+/Pb2+ permease
MHKNMRISKVLQREERKKEGRIILVLILSIIVFYFLFFYHPEKINLDANFYINRSICVKFCNFVTLS